MALQAILMAFGFIGILIVVQAAELTQTPLQASVMFMDNNLEAEKDTASRV